LPRASASTSFAGAELSSFSSSLESAAAALRSSALAGMGACSSSFGPVDGGGSDAMANLLVRELDWRTVWGRWSFGCEIGDVGNHIKKLAGKFHVGVILYCS
jgi:hypothetical protein